MRKKRIKRKKPKRKVARTHADRSTVAATARPAWSSKEDELRALLAHAQTPEIAGEQPATAELSRALLIQVARLFDALAIARPEAAKRAGEVMNQIYTWMTGAPISLSREDLIAQAKKWILAGIEPEFVLKELLAADDAARRPQRGRPVATRAIALRALDEKSNNPRQSWAQLAKKLKYCDDETDLRQCGERLRKQVKELEEFISRLSSGEKS